MDQTAIVNATTEFLQAELLKKDYRIANLEENLQRVTHRDNKNAAEIGNIRNAMQEWTLEALENAQITESEAEEIADICGFELTKEFELEVTVMYSVTVKARDEESAQNAIHDIDFDTVSYNDENISWLSSSIDRIDI